MDTRQRIEEAALRLFTTEGYSRITTDRIAHEAGLGKATLYRYFTSKENLIMACIEDFTIKIEQQTEAILSNPSLTPQQKMNSFLSPVIRFVSHVRPAALADMQRCAPEAYAKIEENRTRLILHNIDRVLREGQVAGVFRPEVNRALVAHTLIGAISHLSQQEVLDQLELPFGQLLERVLSLLWEGCLLHEGSPARKNPSAPLA